jgi:hypothetical protein
VINVGTRSRWKNRRHVSTLDPTVYQNDRVGFLRALRAIHEAALLGCDTRHSYLIVENDRVVGIGGCDSGSPGTAPRRPLRPATRSR